MRRDKGYGGKHRKIKQEVERGGLRRGQDFEGNEELSDYDSEEECPDYLAASTARCITPGTSRTPDMEAPTFDPQYVASIQKELAELKAFKEATMARGNGGGGGGIDAAHGRAQKGKVSSTISTFRASKVELGL
jgi:hypothetical protein